MHDAAGIRPGSILSDVVGSHADLAPTWLALAGLPVAREMDGQSLLPLLLNQPDDDDPMMLLSSRLSVRLPLPLSSGAHVVAVAARRRLAYIEYHGLGTVPGAMYPGIRLLDCFNNTFRALRFVNDSKFGDLMYAEFGSDFLFTGPLQFVEAFDMAVDPWNTRNIVASLGAAERKALHELVAGLWSCQGATCASFFHQP